MRANLIVLTFLLACLATSVTSDALLQPSVRYSQPLRNTGSCTANDQCPRGWVCGTYEVCTPLEGVRLPEAHQWSGTIAFYILFFGMWGAWFVSGCYWTMVTNRPMCHCSGGFAFYAGCPCAMLLLFTLLGLMYVPRELVHDKRPPGTGAVCSAPWDLICEPYQCDMNTSLCHLTCVDTNDCATPNECRGGDIFGDNLLFNDDDELHCYRDNDDNVEGSGRQHGLYDTRILWGLLASVFILSQVTACMCSLSASPAFRTPGWYFTRVGVATMVFAMLIMLPAGIATGYTRIKFVQYHGIGRPCHSNEVCAPLFCDMSENQCREYCGKDDECIEGFSCFNATAQCVPNGGSVQATPLPPKVAAAIGIATAVIVVLALEIPFRRVASVCTRLAPSRCGDRSPFHVLAVQCLFGLTAFLVIFINYGAVYREVSMTAVSGTLIECAAPNAVVCEPYLCDMTYGARTELTLETRGRCLGACLEDAHCAASAVCRGGKCVPATEDREPLRGSVPGVAWPLPAAFTLYFGAVLFAVGSVVLRRVSPFLRTHGLPQGFTTAFVVAVARGLFAVGVVVLVICLGIGMALALPEVSTVGTVSAGAQHTTRACTGALASVCYPHRCDTVLSLCLADCVEDSDCQPGALCLTDTMNGTRCTAVPSRTMLKGLNAAAAVIGLSVPIFVAMLFLIGKVWSDCRQTADACYGQLRPLRVAFIAGMALPVALGVIGGTVLLVWIYEYPFIPSGNGDGPLCVVPEAFQCDPYFCDTRVNLCYSTCSSNGDCRDSFNCIEGHCLQQLDHAGVVAFCVILGLCSAGLLAVVPRWSYELHMRRMRVQEERERIRAEMQRLEDETQQRAWDQAKVEHLAVLNIEPPNPMAKDPSLPTPASYTPVGPGGTLAPRNAALITTAAAETEEADAHGFPAEPAEPERWRCECGTRNLLDVCSACKMTRSATAVTSTSDATPKTAKDERPLTARDVLVRPGPGELPGSIPSPLPRSISAPSLSSPKTANTVSTSTSVVAAKAPPSGLFRVLPPIQAESKRDSTPAATASSAAALPHPTTKPADAAPTETTTAVNATRSSDQRRESITEPTCAICFSAPSTVRMTERKCSHGFCTECAKHTLEAAYEEGQFPARCPGCRAEHPDPHPGERPHEDVEHSFIPSGIIERLARRLVITAEFARRFVHMQLLHAFEPNEVVTCPVCTMLLSAPDWHAKPAQRNYSHLKASCPGCEMSFCANCSGMWHAHRDMDCETFALVRRRFEEDAQSMALISELAKKCPNCGMGVIHYRGHACHHIRPGEGCPNCHTHFCSVCTEPWPCGGSRPFPHSTFCDDRCDCPTCPDCKPGRPCPNCPGGSTCPSCNGITTPMGRAPGAARPPATAAAAPATATNAAP